MRRTLGIISLLVGLLSGLGQAATQTDRRLDIYFLDTVGGGSTLIVTPMGQSVLIDSGSRRPEHRDADRIQKACQDAGLKKINYLITTHFHSDHFGGLPELANRIPITFFMDKGALPPVNEQNAGFKELYELYKQATKGNVKTIRVGDGIPVKNDRALRVPPVKLRCVASEGKIGGFTGDIDAPVESFEIRQPDDTDNSRSIALLLTYDKFECFLGGDITWNVEHHLAHPVNIIGKVDLYQVTHHGLDLSNNPVLLNALSPTVCVAMNGPRKGIQSNTFKALKSLPSVQAIYQIHYNVQYGDAGNTAPEFIANPKEDKGQYIKASVYPEKGIFTISIGPDGEKRSYRIQ